MPLATLTHSFKLKYLVGVPSGESGLRQTVSFLVTRICPGLEPMTVKPQGSEERPVRHRQAP